MSHIFYFDDHPVRLVHWEHHDLDETRTACKLFLEADRYMPFRRCVLDLIFTTSGGTAAGEMDIPYSFTKTFFDTRNDGEYWVKSSEFRQATAAEEISVYKEVGIIPLPFKVISYHTDGVTVEFKGKPKRIKSRIFGAELAELCRTVAPRVKAPRLTRDNLKNDEFLNRFFKAQTDCGSTYLARRD